MGDDVLTMMMITKKGTLKVFFVPKKSPQTGLVNVEVIWSWRYRLRI